MRNVSYTEENLRILRKRTWRLYYCATSWFPWFYVDLYYENHYSQYI